MEQEGRTARDIRQAVRGAREALLAQTYRHSHGRSVRNRRDVPAEERYRAEHRHLSRKAPDRAAWPGITEDDYAKATRSGGKAISLLKKST